MAKKKKPTKPQVKSAPLPYKLVLKLQRADELMEHNRWPEALSILEPLAKEFPLRYQALMPLSIVYAKLGRATQYLEVCERLVKLQPEMPELRMAVGEAYQQTFHFASALREFRYLVEHWPAHEYAAEAQERVNVLTPVVTQLSAEIGLEGEEGLALANAHEKVQVFIAQGKYAEAQSAAETLLARKPDFVQVQNNLSQLYFLDGKAEQAITVARRVLAERPGNWHALANLTHYLYLHGQPEEALAGAEKLKQMHVSAPDFWMKTIETLSYLGDDQGILQAFAAFERDTDSITPQVEPLIYHLTAVALLRTGNEKKAKQLWQRTLAINPGFELALANLTDLKKPVGERHAPFAFDLTQWLDTQTYKELQAWLAPRQNEKSLQRALNTFFERHPEVLTLLPILLERSGPAGRLFAVGLANISERPEVQTALRDFALSQHGPDAMRMQAANRLREKGVLGDGPLRLWIKGAWQELLLINTEIHTEQNKPANPQVERLVQQAHDCIVRQDGVRGEAYLKQALALAPDSPSILNNLATAYSAQRRYEEAEALMRDIHTRFPDYLTGQINWAVILIREKKITEAEALLEPLVKLRRIHLSEYTALCAAEVQLCVAKGEREGAQQWLAMLTQVAPDSHYLPILQKIIDPPKLQKMFRALLPGKL